MSATLAAADAGGTHAIEGRAPGLARLCCIGIVLGTLASPPLANLFEALLALTLVSSPDVRHRLWSLRAQRPVQLALLLYALITVAVVWSAGQPGTAWSIWGGWRKILLLPIAMAVFDTPAHKRRMALTLVAAGAVAFVFSAYSYLADWRPIAEPGVVLQHHQTQSMLMSVAVLASLALGLFASGETPRTRLAVRVAGVAVLLMVAVMTPGRSGFLVLVVGSCMLSWQWLRSSYARLSPAARLAGIATPVMVCAALALSPNVQTLVHKAVDEFETYQRSDVNTSMGLRVYLWRNTLELIAERPLVGYGTGAFMDIYRAKVAGQTGMAGDVRGDPHNQFLKIWVEQGLPGLVLLVALIVSLLRQEASQPWRGLATGTLLAWCVTSLASSHFSMFSEGTFVWVWVGALLGVERERVA